MRMMSIVHFNFAIFLPFKPSSFRFQNTIRLGTEEDSYHTTQSWTEILFGKWSLEAWYTVYLSEHLYDCVRDWRDTIRWWDCCSNSTIHMCVLKHVHTCTALVFSSSVARLESKFNMPKKWNAKWRHRVCVCLESVVVSICQVYSGCSWQI